MIEDFLAVFFLAVLEMWVAIPLGFRLGIPSILLALIVAAGAFSGVIAAMLVGNGVRKLIFWRRSKSENSRTSKWLATKGPWAIGLLGPLLVGPMLAALLAGTAGLPKVLSILLLALGIVIWTIAIIVMANFGIAVAG